MAQLVRHGRRAGGRVWKLALRLCEEEIRTSGLRAALGSGQVAGLAAAAGAGGRHRGSGGGGGGSSKHHNTRRNTPKEAAPAAAPAATDSVQNRLARLCGRFKSRAHANDAAGAERWYLAYVQAGGELQPWMLPMLLGTYGRLRQADKAWAIYQHLLTLRRQQQQQQQQRQASAAAAVAAEHAAAERTPPAVAGGVQQQRDDQGLQQQQRQDQHQQQQQQLESEAGQLVRQLRLDVVPWNEFTYGALITALSRAAHPPYDLPRIYADRAAEAFGEMRERGVQPNVVLWHNLIDCQAKAGLPDAAFASYKAMLAAGAAPTPWTFSMLISACGRAGQPARAAEVVDRLMPQAGVRPSLTVWNSLLGAYGRASSVDAAYAAWMKMLDSGAIPDDCTERVLALAFGSHPALAAEVVAEARDIQRRRRADAAAAAAAEAAAAAAEEAGEGGQRWWQRRRWQVQGATATADAAGQAAAAAAAVNGEGELEEEEVAAGLEAKAWEADVPGEEDGKQDLAPYRLHRHRQARLALDELPVQAAAAAAGAAVAAGGGGLGWRQRQRQRRQELGLMVELPPGSTAAGTGPEGFGDLSSASSSAPGSWQQEQQWWRRRQQEGEGEEEGEEEEGGGAEVAAEGQGLQLRQLLLLDLHGSSQAAARMVLLRRLETLVLQAPALMEEMQRLEQRWHQQRQEQRQRRERRLQQQEVAADLLGSLSADDECSDGSNGSGDYIAGGASGVSSATDSDSSSGSGSAASRGTHRQRQQQLDWQQQEQRQQQLDWQQQKRQQQVHEDLGWPAVGQTSWGAAAAAAATAAGGPTSVASAAGPGPASEARPGRARRFSPPALQIIAGVGRHSRGGRGGVLKGTVRELMQQQGLPVLDDPNNPGVLLVPWGALADYLQRQRQAMSTDRFLTAARVRYMYVAAGVAGLMAAAHILPRLGPWLP